jgi:hypothetical protein
MTNEQAVNTEATPTTPWRQLGFDIGDSFNEIYDLLTRAREIGQEEGRAEVLSKENTAGIEDIVRFLTAFAHRVTTLGLSGAMEQYGTDHMIAFIKSARAAGWQDGLEEGRSIAAMNASSEQISESPSDPQAPSRKPVRIMLIHFMNGAHLEIEMEKIHHAGGWHFSIVNGVESLVVGHGLPRSHYPVSNIKAIDLLTEDELSESL